SESRNLGVFHPVCAAVAEGNAPEQQTGGVENIDRAVSDFAAVAQERCGAAELQLVCAAAAEHPGRPDFHPLGAACLAVLSAEIVSAIACRGQHHLRTPLRADGDVEALNGDRAV